jgi:hypothetical protein
MARRNGALIVMPVAGGVVLPVLGIELSRVLALLAGARKPG